MKLLVKTNNVLLVAMTGDVYEPCRPSVVSNDMFCQTKIAAGVVTVLQGNLPDEATDQLWVKFYSESDGDYELALDSFMASFDAPEEILAEASQIDVDLAAADLAARNGVPTVVEPTVVEPAVVEPAVVEPAVVEPADITLAQAEGVEPLTPTEGVEPEFKKVRK